MKIRIALFSHEKTILGMGKSLFNSCKTWGASVELSCFSEEEQFREAIKTRKYHFVLFLDDSRCSMTESFLKEIRALSPVVLYGFTISFLGFSLLKYTASFCGQDYIIDLRDIYWIESYQRKTTVVSKKITFRIGASLNEEEQRLPGTNFFKIDRYTLVNLQNIAYVEGKKLHMSNNCELEVSYNRIQDFRKTYKRYLERRFIVLPTVKK